MIAQFESKPIGTQVLLDLNVEQAKYKYYTFDCLSYKDNPPMLQHIELSWLHQPCVGGDDGWLDDSAVPKGWLLNSCLVSSSSNPPDTSFPVLGQLVSL